MNKMFGALALFATVATATAQNSLPGGNYSHLQRDFNNRVWMIQPQASQPVSAAQVEPYTQAFLGNGFTIKEKSRETDRFGYTHIRYDILLQGYPVAERGIVAHILDGALLTVNGDLQLAAEVSGAFSIQENVALTAALSKVNAQLYKWQNESETQFMRTVLNDPSFSYEPKGEKVWFEKDGQLHAAWRFNIYAEKPLYRANVFVDAQNSTVLAEHNLICTADVPGNASTRYSGSQTITCNQSGGTYMLKQSTMGQGVETYNMNNGINYGAATNFTSASSTWSLNLFDAGALDAQWGAERTYEYYLSQHNRNSLNNNGLKLVNFVHYSTNYSNAFWDGQRMTFGDGNGGGMRIFTALDVCGHEITHGLTDWTSNLVYSYQSGALNESFSDIFGVAIENHARPSNWNWRIGEDVTSSGVGLRNMSNPNSFGDPDCYLGVNWYSGTNDNGGVHTNSGVPNFWFYLLVTGGSGVNDLSNSYNVQGIGMTKATQIAFRALTLYFTQNTDFAGARASCIQAAKDIFGDCSTEMISTANAWYAVGVGPQLSNSNVNPNFSGNVSSFCAVPAKVTFSNSTPYAQSYSWDFGDGNGSAASDPVHTYTTAGTYAVKLKANGCNNSDSIIKQAFVVVDIPQAPAVAGATVCQGQPVSLLANGNGFLQWFDAPTSTLSLNSGSMMSVPSLTANTLYYVTNSYTAAQAAGGIMTAAAGGYLSNPGHYLTFDVMQQCVLNSVIMYAQAASSRVVELRNASNFVIDSRTVQLQAGATTVTLDFNLTPGTGYRLGLSPSSSGNLYRTTTGVNYPYNVGQCVSINGSSAGSAAYYWFYQWRVTRNPCVSPASPVQANALPLPQVDLAVYSEYNCVEDLVPLTGSPAGGTLTGTALQGNNFYAYNLGVGSYTVTYTYADQNGCENSAARVLYAHECLDVNGIPQGRISVFPNPASNSVQISGIANGTQAVITDNTGRVVFTGAVDNMGSIEVSSLSSGLYMLTVYSSQNELLGKAKIVKN